MSKTVDITARRTSHFYETTVSMGESVFDIKLDTGAMNSVICIGLLNGELTETDLDRGEAYCEKHCRHKEEFIAANGGSFKGYLVMAHDVKMGNTILRDFRYYLVIKNPRDVALLGFDFIDCCAGIIKMVDDVVFTEFDEDGYSILDGVLENDELIAFIDSLSEK